MSGRKEVIFAVRMHVRYLTIQIDGEINRVRIVLLKVRLIQVIPPGSSSR